MPGGSYKLNVINVRIMMVALTMNKISSLLHMCSVILHLSIRTPQSHCKPQQDSLCEKQHNNTVVVPVVFLFFPFFF